MVIYQKTIDSNIFRLYENLDFGAFVWNVLNLQSLKQLYLHVQDVSLCGLHCKSIAMKRKNCITGAAEMYVQLDMLKKCFLAS